MKKLLCLLSVLAILALSVSCKSDGNESETESREVSVSEPDSVTDNVSDDEKSEESDSGSDDDSAGAENTDETGSSDSEQVSEENPEAVTVDNDYKPVTPDLPSEVEPLPVKETDIQFDESKDISLLSLGDDYFSYIASEPLEADYSDNEIYKYDFQSGETVKLDGMEREHYSEAGEYAYCGDKCYHYYESATDRILSCIDFEKNTVSILSKETYDSEKESFYSAFTVSDSKYAVWWFDLYTPQHRFTHTVHHIAIADVSDGGAKKEVFSREFRKTDLYTYYTVGNEKIYEFCEDLKTKECNLNIYDLTGRLLSGEKLDEVTEAFESSEEMQFFSMNVSGPNFFITLADGGSSAMRKMYVYDLEKKTLMTLDNFSPVPNQTSEPSDHYVLRQDAQDESGKDSIFVFNINDGSVRKIAETTGTVITNGKKVLYRSGDESGKICVGDLSDMN